MIEVALGYGLMGMLDENLDGRGPLTAEDSKWMREFGNAVRG